MHYNVRVETPETFWAKVDKSGDCWLWTGTRDRIGYGHLGARWARPDTLAHRISWRIANGPIPHGLMVLHKCDVRPCVNPDHLYLGTQKENARDRHERGRAAPMPSRRKLTDEQVAEIRSSDEKLRVLAERFGVGVSTIGAVRTGQNWSRS